MSKSKRASFGGPTGGKGSTYRKVDKEAYADNWERIFGNRNKPKEKKYEEEATGSTGDNA